MDTKDIIIILSFAVMFALIFKDLYLRRKKMELQEALMYAKELKSEQKERDLNKIMEYVRDKGKITDDMIEGLLDVSDAIAKTYLGELARKGKLIDHGNHYTINYNRKDLI